MSRHAPRFAAALSIALACLPAYAAQRAFVVSSGNDANAASGCTPAAPCRSFQAAHGAVDAGGEIVALDTAGFGAVTVTKSVAIIGNPGTVPSIAVASGAGVTIATADVNVTLRNLNINSIGGPQGVAMTAGSSLTVENCVISNFGNAAIYVYVPANPTPAKVRIAGSIMRGNNVGTYISGNAAADIVGSQFVNGGFGLYVDQGSGDLVQVSVVDSVASGNGTGFFLWAYAGTARMSLVRATASNNIWEGFLNRAENGAGTGTAVMTVGSSMASGNGTGFSNTTFSGGSATFESLGNNLVRQNTAASFGTITSVGGL